MSRRLRSIVVIACAVALLTAACGDDSDSGSDPGALRLRKHTSSGVASAGLLAPVPGVNAPGSGQPDEPVPSDDNVVGGAAATIGQFPWTVALIRPGRADNFCGGVLIAPTVVMTAAHCTVGQDYDANGDPVGPEYLLGPDRIHVIAGRLRLSDAGGQEVKVTEVERAADFDGENVTTDYAFLILESAVNQQAISLPSSSASDLWAPQSVVKVAGWGCQFANTKEDEACEGAGGSPLEYANLEVVDGSTCADVFGSIDANTNLCMVGQGDSSTCQGDSGGPYIAEGPDGEYYLVALVSYGPPGCPPGKPDVGSFVKFLVDGSGNLRGDLKVITCDKGEGCKYPT